MRSHFGQWPVNKELKICCHTAQPPNDEEQINNSSEQVLSTSAGTEKGRRDDKNETLETGRGQDACDLRVAKREQQP